MHTRFNMTRFDHSADCEAYKLTVQELSEEDYWPVSELFIQNTTKDNVADKLAKCTCNCEDIW